MTQLSRTILIVDDSPEDRELYRRYLQRDPNYSYTILEASLGRQGLELWQQQRPDLILLDYRLPDLDGLEFLAQLPSLIPQPCLPVVVMTGQGNETIAVQAMKAGAQDYLVKEQITLEEFHLAVNGAIETVKLRTELQQRIERERVIGQITQQIYQSLDLDRILQTTVTEVRQFLKTDRVLVFQLQPDGNGTVVAESVGDAWQSLLSSEIYDPCLAENYLRFSRPSSITHDPEFAEDYVKRYRQGQVTALPNIHSSDIDPCHIELLAQFQVNANLVVPIQHDDRFWGLLIAHHCAAPRFWQPLEIDLLKELATHLGIALRQAELYQQSQSELAERNRVEAELRESEERFRASVENMLDCFAIYQSIRNEQGEIVDFRTEYVNEAACLNNQLTREQQIGRGLCELLPGHRDNGLFDEYCQVVETGQPLVKDSLVYEDDYGQQRLIRAFDIRIAKFGDGYIATWRNITERKQTEESLRENEQLLRLALAGAQAGSWDWEIATGKVTWSPENYALYGVDPANTTSCYETWYNALHPDDREAMNALVSEVIEQRLPEFRSEFRIIHPQLGLRWLLGLGQLMLDDQGNPLRLSGINLDITDRFRSEEALRQSEDRFRTLADNMSQLAWMAHANGDIFWYNQRWFNYTGKTLEEMQGWEWQKVHHPDHVDRVVQHIRHCFETGQLWEDTFPLQRQDGQYRWFLSRAIPIRNEQGEITCWFGTNTDITERKQSEMERDRLLEQEQAAREFAERANRIKDEFLAVLSHELRSPLNPILGWTKLMQSRKFDTTKTNEALATIERNARLQTQLIDDLLDVAKILRGKLSMNAAPVDLVFVIEQAIDTVRTAAVAKNITLHAVLPQMGRVSGDSARLQQIVWNLLSNAIKFTPAKGQVEVRLDREGNQAKITVSDTGKGINPDFLPHIFESFRQEDASTTRQYGGLGLGLAIVRHLIEAHGGTICADSPGEGQGATFIVQLPLLDAESEQPTSETVSLDEIDLTGVRILAVDDEPDARELLTALLTQYGAEVLTVTSATEVLTYLESFYPDVLISDIGMPEMDGYMLMQQIRALPPEKGGRILAIALTAYARGEDYQQAIASGYQRHLTKPLDLDQLVKAVVELTCHNTFESVRKAPKKG